MFIYIPFCYIFLLHPTTSSPDFVIDQELFSSLTISVEYIPEGDCEFNEGCVLGIGEGILVIFDTGVANIGTSDFILGDPSSNPSICSK